MRVFERYVKGEFLSREETIRHYYENNDLYVKLPPLYYKMDPTDIQIYLERLFGFATSGASALVAVQKRASKQVP